MKQRFSSECLFFIIIMIMIIGIEQNTFSQNVNVKAFNRKFDYLNRWVSFKENCTYSSFLGIRLPFDFEIYGVKCRNAHMSGSLGLRLSKDSITSQPFYCDYNSQFDFLGNTKHYRTNGAYIYPFWAYHNYKFESKNSMCMSIEGFSPNRKIILEWKNFCWYGAKPDTGVSINVQITLYETSNIIEIHFGDMIRQNITIGKSYLNLGYYWCTALIGIQEYSEGDWPYNLKYINIDPNGNGNMGLYNWEWGNAGKPLSRGYNYHSTVRKNEDFDAIKKGDVIQISFGNVTNYTDEGLKQNQNHEITIRHNGKNLEIDNLPNGQCAIDIHDISGRLISKLFEGIPENTNQMFSLNTEEFKKGIYFCSVKTKENIQVLKLIVQ